MDHLPSVRSRARTPKRKTRNRRILLQNLNKGKARKEDRCAFQLIPYPVQFANSTRIYCLYADVVLMERQDTLVSEASLFNNFKIYKDAQVVDRAGQKTLKIKTESKNIPADDWRQVVARFESSESSHMKDWAASIKNFCEKYETAIQDLRKEQESMSPQRLQKLKEMTATKDKVSHSLFKTYPCIEFRCELKDGDIQNTEIAFSEKYLAEIGYSLEAFASTVLSEGIPEVTPLNSPGAIGIAKVRLQRCLTMGEDQYESREVETGLKMKNGYIKKVKLRTHYFTFYEKGVLGYIFHASIVARQKIELPSFKLSEGEKFNTDFVDVMSEREKEANYFLSNFYAEKVEQKYTNLNRTCKIKEITDHEEI